jgi:hypothetical protein
MYPLWEVFFNYRSSPHFWATSLPGYGNELISTKNGFGYILGDIFPQAHLVTLLATSNFIKSLADAIGKTSLQFLFCPDQ